MNFRIRKMRTRTLILSFVITVALAIALSAAAIAAVGYTVSVNNHAVGVAPSNPPPPSPTYTFTLFESDGVTPLADPINWGNINVGAQATHNVVVKNTGNQSYSVVAVAPAIPSGWSLTGTNSSGISPGSSATITLTLTTTVPGPVDFITNFNAEY